jgi:glycopeptide antibiotics resistance protein
MKILPKTIFGLYLLTLLWLVLFKFSFDISGVLLDHQARSLNLIPFASSHENIREMISNLVVFIPFGLLLGITFKQINHRQKLATIFAFSLATEAIQYALAIGASDITDVIANTLGGLMGLTVYRLGAKHIDNKKLDWAILITNAVLMITFILWRVLFLRVRY